MKQSKYPITKAGFILIGAVFLFYFYIALTAPLIHDDWTWGSYVGLNRLYSGFKDYNGRYLGNLLELLLTRVLWLRVLLMGSVSAILIFLTAWQHKKNWTLACLLSIFLYLCLPLRMFSQTFSWTAGFTNYITSIVLVLIYILWIRNVFEKEPPQYARWKTIVASPLGLATQLFIEHITIYVVVMSLGVIVFTFIKFRKVYALQIVYSLCCIIGAAIMFSNGAYRQLFLGSHHHGAVHLHHMNGGGIKILQTYVYRLNDMLFSHNIVLNFILAALCLFLIMRAGKQRWTLLKYCLVAIMMSYPLYYPLIQKDFHVNVFGRYSQYFDSGFSILFYTSMLLVVFLFLNNSVIKQKCIFYLLSVPILSLPLLFVHPVNDRCFLAAYAFFALVGVELFVLAVNTSRLSSVIVKKLLVITTVFLSCVYLYVFTLNYMVSEKRIHYLVQHAKSHDPIIVLPQLPYEQFLWQSTPPGPSKFQYKTFKAFYHIPKGTRVKFISYKKWKKAGGTIL